VSEHTSAFSPLRHRTFGALWAAITVAFIGGSMQALGAQWFLVSTPGGAPLVPLVQAFLTLPMALLALPAGVLADSLDRRKLLIGVQVAALAAAVALTGFSYAGLLTPFSVLALTGLLASAMALTLTPFQSLIPDLVTRPRITAAAALLSVGANTARILGPALAGLIIAVSSESAVFAVDSLLILAFLAVLLRWNGRGEVGSKRERFMPALRSGVRYVRHSPQVLKLMLRGFWFTTAMMGLMSVLPLIATSLGAGSAQLGLLLAAQGAGAIVGALALPWTRRRLSANSIVALSFVVGAGVLALIPWAPGLVAAALLMAVAGWCWTTALTTMAAAMQIYLPAWVRARGLAMFSVAVYGGQALGSLLSGWAVVRWGTTPALVLGAGLLLAGSTAALWLPLRNLGQLDRTPSISWPDPELVVDPDELGGEVVVSVAYWVAPQDEAEFLDRVPDLRRIRLRNGATRWRLMQDAETAGRFVEEYTVGSWHEYELQQLDRLVASDQAVELAVQRLSSRPTVAHHYLRVGP
jgi:predicted MFS family arabinose efflux permease